MFPMNIDMLIHYREQTASHEHGLIRGLVGYGCLMGATQVAVT